MRRRWLRLPAASAEGEAPPPGPLPSPPLALDYPAASSGVYWVESPARFYPARRHTRRRGWHEVDPCDLIPQSHQQPHQQEGHSASPTSSQPQQQQQQQQEGHSSTRPGLTQAVQQLEHLRQLTGAQLVNLQLAAVEVQAAVSERCWAVGQSAESASSSASAWVQHQAASCRDLTERQLHSLQALAEQLRAAYEQLAPTSHLQQQLGYLRKLTSEQLANLQQAVAQLAQQRQQQQQAPQQHRRQRQAPAQQRQAPTEQQRQRSQQLEAASVAAPPPPATGPWQLPLVSQPVAAHWLWVALGAAAGVLLLWRAAVRRRPLASSAPQLIQEAEARARAAQRMERQRQRFLGALLAAEDLEDGGGGCSSSSSDEPGECWGSWATVGLARWGLRAAWGSVPSRGTVLHRPLDIPALQSNFN